MMKAGHSKYCTETKSMVTGSGCRALGRDVQWPARVRKDFGSYGDAYGFPRVSPRLLAGVIGTSSQRGVVIL